MTNPEFECERTLLVQADFDGELDAAEAAALIEHERQCAHCRRVRGQLMRSRELLHAAPRYAASDQLREAIAQRLQAATEAAGFGEKAAVDGRLRSGAAVESPRPASPSVQSARAALAAPQSSRAARLVPPARRAPLAWISAIAAAVALIAVVLMPRAPDVGAQLVANHVRAMQLESHLIDVVSSDHHTVKPWFAGKVSFAPLVKQLDSEGYILKGGRVDIVNGAPAAVLVYQVGRHIVDLYQWPASAGILALRKSTQLDGFNLRHWEEDGLAIWCVTDLNAEELDRFTQRWRQ